MSSLLFAWQWPEFDHVFGELAAVTFLALLVHQKITWNWRSVPIKKRQVFTSQECKEEPITRTGAAALPSYPHLQMCSVPYSGKLFVDGQMYEFENDMCVGSSMAFHRNTWDQTLERKGEYIGYEFPGKAVKWEKRIQLRLKDTPKGTLKFGIELDEYVPVDGATRMAMKLIVAAMKLIVGEDLYHSVGDDPAVIDGEIEKPIFSMPMWAFDQIIETPEGEEPPSLSAPNFHNLGIRRQDDTKQFAQKLANMNWRPGPTYTLSFWSISRMLDLALWKISGAFPGVEMNMGQFCGKPPVHIVIYDFRPSVSHNKTDSRHLDSAKRYLFHTALWSSQHHPPDARLKQLLPSSQEVQVNNSEEKEDHKKFRGCYCCF